MNSDSYSLLVVDDEAHVATTTAAILSRAVPCPVLVSTSATDALRVMRDHEVAVLVCDYRMPEIDGLELIKKAHEMNGRTVSVLVTALASKEVLIRALNEGCAWKCMEKPWHPDDLAMTAREALAIYLNNVSRPDATKTAALRLHHLTTVTLTTESGEDKIQRRREPERILLKESNGAAATKRGSSSRRKSVSPGAWTGVVKGRQGAPPLPRLGDRYTDLKLISSGGLGAVYKANDAMLGMPVAIKVLSLEAGQNKAAMASLFEEARIAMQLTHNHIVRLHNIDKTDDGRFYLIMEYIDGCTFRELLEERGSLPADVVLKIVTICEDALGYAHRRKIYHRDLKPSNLMLTRDGVLKIIDLGLACLAERKTDDEIVGGTPYYMSPEQIAGDPVDQRTDIYSLGIMVHEFLTGQLPFDEGMADMDKMEFLPVASSKVALPLRRALQKSFALKPSDRWQTVHEFAEAFRRACRRP